MHPLAASALREAYRRELLPARVRWWLAARGMRDWMRLVAKRLEEHLGAEARPISAELAGRMLERRYDALRQTHSHLPSRDRDPRAVGLVMGALYRMRAGARDGWILDAVGGAPRGPRELVRAARLVAPLGATARWEEVTVHLGEWLIVLTESLPERLPRARQIVADICFDAGAAYAGTVRRVFRIEPDGDPAKGAIELLRMTEYLFRVNPEHWHETDPAAGTGYLEGTACPWYSRPGWQRLHCGIFGQFQAGIASSFGLRYQLTRTIPKHGGHTCRIDLVPLTLRAS